MTDIIDIIDKQFESDVIHQILDDFHSIQADIS